MAGEKRRQEILRYIEESEKPVSGQKLAQDYAFDFTTALPQVNSVRPTNNERWINLYPTLYVVFNMPVDMQTVSDYVELSYMQEPEPTLSEKIGLSKNKRPAVKKNLPLKKSGSIGKNRTVCVMWTYVSCVKNASATAGRAYTNK